MSSQESLIFAVTRLKEAFSSIDSILRRRDRSCIYFASAHDALERMRHEKPRLLVFDFDLGDLTAPEFCRRVRDEENAKETSLLFIADRDAAEHIDLCMAAGCNDIVTKPIDARELDDKVTRLTSIPSRKELRTLVKIEVAMQHNAYYMLGHSKNISASGMLLEVAQVLPPEATLRLQFYLRGEAEPVRVPARIVRAEFTGGLPRYGMQFTVMTERDKVRIEKFVSRMRSREFL